MKRLMLLSVFLILAVLAGTAQASLEVIGTATYQGQDYKLIYMDDGPFGPVTWLDYTNDPDDWQNQVDWATNLGELEVSLYEGYILNQSAGWRLPEVDESQANLSGINNGYAGPDGNGYHDYRTGFNMVNGEMGYLFYEELGNRGFRDTSGNSQSGYGLTDPGKFEHLQSYSYWSGTEYDANHAWEFEFHNGGQYNPNSFNEIYGIAVLPGTVSSVPLPGAFILFGSAIAVLAAFKRKNLRK